MTKDRQRNSIEVFNEYVNELISEYQTTGKVNYEELARKHSCRRLPRNRFFLMHLNEVTRCLNMRETEQIWEYVGDPKNIEAPIFCDAQDDAALAAPPSTEFSFEATSETSEDNDNTTNWLSNFIAKAKNKIQQLFVRDKIDGFYIQQAITSDGDNVFCWFDQYRRIDYVLRMRDDKIVSHGVVTDGSDLKKLKLDRLQDGSQSFHVAFALKTLLAEADKKIAIYEAKLNAIEEILLIEENKL